jgi:type II secretory pathway component PulK
VLGLSVVVFTSGIAAWLSLLAALVAGVAALLTGAATQVLLLQNAGPQQAASVMALWAVAWAGSKPVASFADGWLASTLGVRWAGLLLATPALAVAVLELHLSEGLKQKLKDFAYDVIPH